ncbi:MAG: hypothetical protein AB8I08_18695 [Sandaracinaceae bacterium]
MRAFVRGNDFDSRLSGNVLTIIVNVLINKTDAGELRDVRRNDNEIPTVEWPAEHWAAWPGQFKQIVHDAWHNRFELQCTPEDHEGLQLERLECHLELNVSGIDDAYESPPHCVARVDYFSDTQFAVSSARVRQYTRDERNIDMWLDYGDIIRVEKRTGVFQYGVVHEFGHYLGLRHRCFGVEGRAYCGGVAGVDGSDIMAAGDTPRPWHAEPWLRRLARHNHLQTENWWAVVVGDPERSGEVQPSDTMSNLERQNAMKSTAGMDQADIDAMLARAAAGNESPATALSDSVHVGLGLPLLPP